MSELRLCPACHEHPDLIKGCLICRAKGQVMIEEITDGMYAITPKDEKSPTYIGAGPADVSLTKRQSVQQGWLGFAAAAIPDGAPPAQRIDMRRTWFAGVSWVLAALQLVAIQNISEEETEAYMESIEQELIKFASRVSRGLA